MPTSPQPFLRSTPRRTGASVLSGVADRSLRRAEPGKAERMLGEDILYLSLRELGKRIKSRTLSPVELTESYLARSERLGGRPLRLPARPRTRGKKVAGRAAHRAARAPSSRRRLRPSPSAQRPGARLFALRHIAGSPACGRPTVGSAATAPWRCHIPWTRSARWHAPPTVARWCFRPSPRTIRGTAARFRPGKLILRTRTRRKAVPGRCASAG